MRERRTPKTSRPNPRPDGWHYFLRARWYGGFRLRPPLAEEVALRARCLPRRELRPQRVPWTWLACVPALESPECSQLPEPYLYSCCGPWLPALRRSAETRNPSLSELPPPAPPAISRAQ